jgi:hypothetical protein
VPIGPVDNISELAPILKTRTPRRDPSTRKKGKGFLSLNVPPGKRPIQREFARKR